MALELLLACEGRPFSSRRVSRCGSCSAKRGRRIATVNPLSRSGNEDRGLTVLMITVETADNVVTCRFDGRLAGPEALELTRNWSTAAFKQPDQSVVFDLSGVISIDAVGVEFLAEAQRNGCRLIDGGMTTSKLEPHRWRPAATPPEAEGMGDGSNYYAATAFRNHSANLSFDRFCSDEDEPK
jgi:anti-anti-sigma regulatory factor